MIKQYGNWQALSQFTDGTIPKSKTDTDIATSDRQQ